MESVAFVGAEADLAGSAVMIADAADVPVGGLTGFPSGSRSTLRCAEERGVAAAWILPTVVLAAAVVWILEVWIRFGGTVRIVGGVERSGIVELHMSEGGRGSDQRAGEDAEGAHFGDSERRMWRERVWC